MCRVVAVAIKSSRVIDVEKNTKPTFAVRFGVFGAWIRWQLTSTLARPLYIPTLVCIQGQRAVCFVIVVPFSTVLFGLLN